MNQLSPAATKIRNAELHTMGASMKAKYQRDAKLRSIMNALYQTMADSGVYGK